MLRLTLCTRGPPPPLHTPRFHRGPNHYTSIVSTGTATLGRGQNNEERLISSHAELNYGGRKHPRYVESVSSGVKRVSKAVSRGKSCPSTLLPNGTNPPKNTNPPSAKHTTHYQTSTHARLLRGTCGIGRRRPSATRMTQNYKRQQPNV